MTRERRFRNCSGNADFDNYPDIDFRTEGGSPGVKCTTHAESDSAIILRSGGGTGAVTVFGTRVEGPFSMTVCEIVFQGCLASIR